VGGVRYEDALALVRDTLSSKAVRHCQRVADSAAALATTYKVDVSEARLAGLLHDLDRERPGADLLAEARAAGLALCDVDVANPHLLHARIGAIDAARALPGLDDEIVSAIARHTLGAPHMSDLDMVVFIADMIETHRDYAGVEELRAAVGRVGLFALFAQAYSHSVHHLVDAGKLIHPQTVAVWNWIVAGDGA